MTDRGPYRFRLKGQPLNGADTVIATFAEADDCVTVPDTKGDFTRHGGHRRLRSEEAINRQGPELEFNPL